MNRYVGGFYFGLKCILSTLIDIIKLFLKVVILICNQMKDVFEFQLLRILINVCYCQPLKIFTNLMVSHYDFNTNFSDF